jgi:hypothetical protein
MGIKEPSLLGIATPRVAKLKWSRVNLEAFTMTHYHIRWSGKEELDWEAFDTRAEVEASAKQLVRPGEAYTIEEHDETCPRCRTAMEAKLMRDIPNEASA